MTSDICSSSSISSIGKGNGLGAALSLWGLVLGGTEVGRRWVQGSVWGALCERTRLVAKG